LYLGTFIEYVLSGFHDLHDTHMHQNLLGTIDGNTRSVLPDGVARDRIMNR